jgi:hypothetical protein
LILASFFIGTVLPARSLVRSDRCRSMPPPYRNLVG